MKKRSKKEIINRMNEVGLTTRFCNGSCPTNRADTVGEIDKENRTVPFILVSSENAGERYDWWEDEIYIEELSIEGANFSNLRTFFKDHTLRIDNAIGRVDNCRIEEGQIRAEVAFSPDLEAEKIFERYAHGTLSDVSVGYLVRDVIITEKKDAPTHVLVTDYEIVELSAVWRGFDAGAGRRASMVKDEKLFDKRDLSLLKRKLNLKGKTC